MIRIQRDRRFNNEALFVVPDNPQAHGARDRDLFVEKRLRTAKRALLGHARLEIVVVFDDRDVSA